MEIFQNNLRDGVCKIDFFLDAPNMSVAEQSNLELHSSFGFTLIFCPKEVVMILLHLGSESR